VIDRAQERDDELLSAWLDDELPEDQAEELASRLAREPALARRLEAMRSVDSAAVAALSSIDEQPIPERILDLLGPDADEPQQRGSATGNVVPLKRPMIARFLQAPVAIAASVALAVGFYLSTILGNGAGAPTEFGALAAGRILQDSKLYAAFDRGLSDSPVPVGGGRVAEPVLTFRSEDGAYCRQLHISGGPEPADALACRRNGNWELELLSFDPAPPRTPRTFYGPAAYRSSAALQAAIEGLIGRAPPLDAAEEAAIVENEWQQGE
jgi:hypothetical protein